MKVETIDENGRKCVCIKLNGHYIEVKADGDDLGVIVDVFDNTVAGGDLVSTSTHWKDDLVDPEYDPKWAGEIGEEE